MGGLSIHDVEERGLAVGIVLDLEAFLSEFGNKLLDALGLMDLHETGSAAAGVLVGLGDLLDDGTILTVLSLGGFGIEEVEIDILGGEVAEFGFVVEILDAFVVTIADDDEVGRKGSFGRAGVKVGLKFSAETADGLARLLKPV